MSRARLVRAMKFMRANFCNAPKVADIAGGVGLSPFYFHREFTGLFGITPKRVLLELQIQKSKRLMLRGVPLAKVATMVGFNHQSHFTLRFRQSEGIPPARWLRMTRGAGTVGQERAPAATRARIVMPIREDSALRAG
jgi:AraC-like DNA-binding protein